MDVDNTDRRILILGAGPQQLKLISKARARGAFVVVLDRNRNAPGVPMASQYVECDMLDIGKAVSIAKKYKIDAIATGGSDQVMLTVAAIAEACHLPCHLSEESAFRATNKVAMTQGFQKWGVPVGRRAFLKYDQQEKFIDDFHYPLVIKPADAQGQIGMSLIGNQTQLREAICLATEHSRSKTVTVEEFIEGPEIAAGAWLVDGKLHLLAVTDRPTYNPPPSLGISLQHILPSKAAENNLDEIADMLAKVASAYDVTQGPLHAQIIMSPSGPKMMEVGCRYGGANEVDLYKHALGIDEIELLLDLAFGHPQHFDFDIRHHGFKLHGVINMVVAREGVLAKHESMDRFIQTGEIIDGGWYRKNGFIQQKIIDAYGRIGWFLVTGNTREAVLARAADLYSKLSVTNESGENLIFWPDRKYLNSCDR